MTEMIRVRFPRSQTGWALLALSDFHKPRSDGSHWERWVPDERGAGADPSQADDQNPPPIKADAESSNPMSVKGAQRKTRKPRQTGGE